MNSNNYNSLIKIAAADYDHYEHLENSKNKTKKQNANYPVTKPSKITGGIPLTQVADIEKKTNEQWDSDKLNFGNWFNAWGRGVHKFRKVPFIQGQGSPVGFDVDYGIQGDPRSSIERYDDSALAQRQALSKNEANKKIVAQNLDQIFAKHHRDSQERARRGLQTTPRDTIGQHTLYMNPDGTVNTFRANLDALKSGIARWNILKGHPLNPAELSSLASKYSEFNNRNQQLEDGFNSIPTDFYLTSPGNAAIESHNANKPERP